MPSLAATHHDFRGMTKMKPAQFFKTITLQKVATIFLHPSTTPKHRTAIDGGYICWKAREQLNHVRYKLFMKSEKSNIHLVRLHKLMMLQVQMWLGVEKIQHNVYGYAQKLASIKRR